MKRHILLAKFAWGFLKRIKINSLHIRKLFMIIISFVIFSLWKRRLNLAPHVHSFENDMISIEFRTLVCNKLY